MNELQKRLEDVAHSLGLTHAARAFARGRVKAKARKARRLDRRAEVLRSRSQAERKQGHRQSADALGAQATETEALALKAHAGKRTWIGKVKRLHQKIEGLEQTETELKARLAAVKKQQAAKAKPKVKGNKVTGGANGEARMQVCLLTAAANCAAGRRDNFYSQVGDYDIKHCLTGPSRGHRDDCSSFGTSTYWSIGAPDPNKTNWTGGYTGTLVAQGREVSREYARNHAGVAVIFGPGTGHHVEWSIGDGTEHTVGHGSAAVDMGTFDLLPGEVRFFAFDLN